ncbi:hypothetical protein [Frondihabitans australicus]|uniref:Uncharacterized protein n=1 Tax=Frondihabitans australicus TaxID=386892 RepID=A0A495IBN5_9MICO|nr:hypothetical protein [Frondihabitans australicus]RKR73404.1 hypothetical protein C8E83_0496 [Frondihabitans australicus]
MTNITGYELPFDLDLTGEERALLRRGLNEWGGPARPTDALAVMLGFADKNDLWRSGEYLRKLLQAQESMTATDWHRILFAVEVVFVSDRWGSGWDWSITTGFSDEATIGILRSIQRKLSRRLRSLN